MPRESTHTGEGVDGRVDLTGWESAVAQSY